MPIAKAALHVIRTGFARPVAAAIQIAQQSGYVAEAYAQILS